MENDNKQNDATITLEADDFKLNKPTITVVGEVCEACE